MKKLLTLCAAVLFCIGASAQIVSSQSSITRREKVEKVKSHYNRLYVSYNPHNFKYKGDDDLNCTGFSFGYLRGFNLTNKIPLFMEIGGNLNYSWKKDSYDINNYYYGSSTTVDTKFTYACLSIPVNVVYRYSFGKGMSVAPFFGLAFKGNLLADYDDGDDTYSMFDSDEDGDDEYSWKRFQVGFQIGAGFNYKALYVGLHYGGNFGEIGKNVKCNNWGLTLGVNF